MTDLIAEPAVEPLMYSDESLAKACSISKWTVERARKSGELPAYNIGSLVRIDRVDALNWVRSKPWEPKRAGA
ncbi:helix-turn-helix domain-containing protein [Rhodococcus globerulus]|uniref:helix-turn-helix domain-containing protein n=1 Tax=Rhodococcus globerulus TaxID=33008 RepID=UPI00279EB58E